jgi:hypothetical protein
MTYLNSPYSPELWALAYVYDPWLGIAPRAPRPDADPRLQDMRLKIHVIAEAWRKALDSGHADELRQLALSGLQVASILAPVVVTWFDLVETIVQEIERERGTAPGHGEQKAVEAEAMLRYIFDQLHLFDGLVAHGFQAPLHDYLAHLGLDAIVTLLNERKLWIGAGPAPEVSFSIRNELGRLVARIAGWLYEQIRPVIVLSSTQKRLADQAIATLNDRVPMMTAEFQRLTLLVIGLRSQIKPLMTAVAAAVDLAEQFVSMEGQEKRAYAVDLLLVAAEEYGIIAPDSEFRPFLTLVLGALVDGVVRIFNKRQYFVPSHHPEAMNVAANP